MAIPLYETINSAVTLYLQLKQQADSGKANELRKAAQDVVTAFQKLVDEADNLKKSGGDHDAAVARIEAVVTMDEGIDLNLFFDQVSSAVVKAQAELDQASLAYNGSLPADSPIPATLYAIPSVKAEMKLGFSQVSTKGVNVVVFQNNEQKQRYGESTITFEITASPLPPNQATLPKPGPGSPPAAGRAEPPAVSAGAPPPAPPPRVLGRTPRVPLAGFVSEEGPAPVEAVRELPPLTLPLEGEAQTRAIASLKALLGAGRSELLAHDERLVVLPSDVNARSRQEYLYLLPGSRTPGDGPGLRAFRVWWAAFEAGKLSLLPNRFSAPAALEDGALTIPASRDGLRQVQDLAGLIRDTGDVLNQIVVRVRLFNPQFLVTSSRDAKAYERVRNLYEDLLEDGDFAILRDRTRDGAGYILLRPVLAAGTREWSELHAVLMSRLPGPRAVPPRLLIPDVRVLESWAASSPENLVLLAQELERLLRRLCAVFQHGGR